MNKEELRDYCKEASNEIVTQDEQIRRLEKENQKLKQKYLNAVADYETAMSENQQLKIQISAREEVCNKLENNWNTLWQYILEKDNRGYEKVYTEDILDKMQELEQGSDSNE